MTTGRIDVHSHLLPGVDDGCRTVQESVQCARLMADAGYTHSFCTPHVWPHLSRNTVAHIPRYTEELQSAVWQHHATLYRKRDKRASRRSSPVRPNSGLVPPNALRLLRQVFRHHPSWVYRFDRCMAQ